MANKTQTEEWRNCATAWFAALERAVKTDDFQLAAEAQQQLMRLGYIITTPKQQKVRKEKLSNASRTISSYAKKSVKK